MKSIKKAGFVALCLCVAGLLGVSLARADITSSQHKLQIVSPAAGTEVTPGHSIKIVVTADAWVGTAMILAQKPLPTPEDTQTPMQFILNVPDDIPEGDYAIKAISEVRGQYVESPSVTIKVKWPRDIKSIRTDKDNLSFDAPAQNVQLKVTGTFGDGSELNVTRMIDTTYVSSNPHVAVVSHDGIVSSMNIGHTVITVSNAATSHNVDVIVHPANHAISGVQYTIALSMQTMTTDEHGNYVANLMFSNRSNIPLQAIQLTLATLNDQPAEKLPPLKKGYSMNEQWPVTLTFPKAAGVKGTASVLHLKGVYSALPEGYYDPKDLEYSINLNLP